MSGVDAYTIAALLDLQPATIRQWKRRGLIKATGRDTRGRTLYDPRDVAMAAARHDTPTGARSAVLSEPSVTVTPGTAVPSSGRG